MSNYLIKADGARFVTTGMRHETYCRTTFKMLLKNFLKAGGCRVKTFREHIAIETGEPLTVPQRQTVCRILHDDNYYTMVICIGGKWNEKEKFRPIRKV